MEKPLKISAYLCKVSVGTIVWEEIKIVSTNSAADYHENQFSRKTINTYIYLKISLVMVNKSTDMQMYNDSKQQSKNLSVYYIKTTMVFYNFFDLLEWKNWMKYGKFTNKYVPNKHTEESVNFPVTKRILTSMFFSLRSLGAKIRVNIYSLKLIDLIFQRKTKWTTYWTRMLNTDTFWSTNKDKWRKI